MNYLEFSIMNIDGIRSLAPSIGGGFLGGLLLGYVIRKIIRVAAVVVGLFITGLAFLQYQHIVFINWNKIEGSIAELTNSTVNILNENSITTSMMSNFGIPLTSSMASGFTVGFMKG